MKARPIVADLVIRYATEHGRTVSFSQQAVIDMALAPLAKHYGACALDDFGPNKLRDLRERMLQRWSPYTTSKAVGVVKHAFRWAVAHELCAAETRNALNLLEPLRNAKPEPVGPAPDGIVNAVVERIAEPYKTMIRLQLATGMRPGELCAMRPCDIDVSGDVWVYRPASHKSQWRGRGREIYLGPTARALIDPLPTQIAERMFRVLPGTYRQKVARTCKELGITPFTPNQLRHNYATMVRSRYGIEAARVLLGHADAGVTLIYAERDAARAKEIAKEIG